MDLVEEAGGVGWVDCGLGMCSSIPDLIVLLKKEEVGGGIAVGEMVANCLFLVYRWKTQARRMWCLRFMSCWKGRLRCRRVG